LQVGSKIIHAKTSLYDKGKRNDKLVECVTFSHIYTI